MRWRFALIAFFAAVVVMTALMLAGVEFRRGDRDLTIVIALAIELAFGVWGFALGRSVEGRAADARAARETRAHLEQLSALQARVAHLEKLASLGQLAGSIAHEVRNPLAIVRTMVQNLAETPEPPAADRDKACAAMIEEIDRLARVTDSLVGLARPVRPQFDAVPVREVMARVEWLAQRLTGQALALQTHVPPADTLVRADSDLLCQLLLGLVANAAQASRPGAAIDLACRAGDRDVEFTVTDAGPGVPPDLRDRIFEPFFTTRPGGSGLGLAVARQIVDAHGGRIAVEDTPGGGARFVVRLAAAT